MTNLINNNNNNKKYHFNGLFIDKAHLDEIANKIKMMIKRVKQIFKGEK